MPPRSRLTALLGLAPVAHATVREWDGDEPMDNKWTTVDNWVGNVAPDPGDDLLFVSGARHPQNENDFAPDTTFNSIELRAEDLGLVTPWGQPDRLERGPPRGEQQRQRD